jgi:hypothetical protein
MKLPKVPAKIPVQVRPIAERSKITVSGASFHCLRLYISALGHVNQSSKILDSFFHIMQRFVEIVADVDVQASTYGLLVN